jgi:pyruvate/2-oxoglutarate dehydrogenase complex dihydrolipoamide acyltransferase (E2) component
MPTKVIMPQLGESVVEGTVTKWLKKEGESIDEYEALLEVNTDKVDTEIPSPAGGTVLKLLVAEGITVTAGTVLAWIGQPGEEIPVGETGPETHSPATIPTARQVLPSAPAPASSPQTTRDLGFISPVVAKIAKEHNVDLQQVSGTGQGGRITKKDVLAFVESNPAGAPAAEIPIWETPADGDLFRPTEMMFKNIPESTASRPETEAPVVGDQLIPHTNIRRSIAEHMIKSKSISAHVTTVMEVDLSSVVAHRAANKAAFARDGVNLTYTAYFMAAIVSALKAFPQVNSSWSDEGLVLHAAINIGMATSLAEAGLIVPVIKSADGLSLLGLARAVNDLAQRARDRKLLPDEVKGGTFTLTNHGTSGSLFATPIINQPQCGILGVGMVQKRAVVINDAIAIRPMVYISLTFDHRILDGASADWFLAKVVDTLQNWA